MGKTMKGRKLYTMPSSTAWELYISCTPSKPIHLRTVLIRPESSSRLIQAMVRRRKFIHMGMMKSTTSVGPIFILRSAMNSAAG